MNRLKRELRIIIANNKANLKGFDLDKAKKRYKIGKGLELIFRNTIDVIITDPIYLDKEKKRDELLKACIGKECMANTYDGTSADIEKLMDVINETKMFENYLKMLNMTDSYLKSEEISHASTDDIEFKMNAISKYPKKLKDVPIDEVCPGIPNN